MQVFRKWLPGTVLSMAVMLMAPQEISAESFSFDCISTNPTNCDIVETQFLVEVSAVGTNQVLFHFTNTGTGDSSLADVFFNDQDPRLLGDLVGIAGSSGVEFSEGCSPGNLPGGAPLGFETTYCVDSNAPVQPKGVNPGEWLSLTYALNSGYTVDDLLTAMHAGDYQIGIHVQGFRNGGSVSAITRVPVPEPSSLLLSSLGLIGLATSRLRRPRTT